MVVDYGFFTSIYRNFHHIISQKKHEIFKYLISVLFLLLGKPKIKVIFFNGRANKALPTPLS